MNREETIALWQKGKGAWNTWARAMLAERKRLEEGGEWESKKNDWEERAKANFEGLEFTGRKEAPCNFSECVFPGSCSFSNAKFEAIADFSKSEFHGMSAFGYVQFLNTAVFRKCIFKNEAAFGLCFFSKSARFKSCEFRKDVRFDGSCIENLAEFMDSSFLGGVSFYECNIHHAQFFGSEFLKRLSFAKTKFTGNIIFCAMKCNGWLQLRDSIFLQPPDFTQASFREPPRLDTLRIEPPEGYKAGPEDAARWRALRRMAAQAGDHVQEAEFFAQELQAHRGYADKPHTSARWWLGWGYQIGSDFGRSAPLPFLWLSNLVVWFSLLYAWLGEGFQVGRAALLSLKNALPFLFVGQDTGGLYDALYPHGVPLGVTALGAFETFCGGVLVFLLILGARYTLRVR